MLFVLIGVATDEQQQFTVEPANILERSPTETPQSVSSKKGRGRGKGKKGKSGPGRPPKNPNYS